MLPEGAFMNKKAMELSLNTIVIAIIVIIVLIVVVFIFIQRSNVFGKSVDPTCAERGGNCRKVCLDTEYAIYSIRGCTAEGVTATEDKSRGTCCIVTEQKTPGATQ